VKLGSLCGYRKVIVGLLLLSVGILLDFTLGLSSNVLELIKFLAIGFFIGNGVEHVSKAVTAKLEGDINGDGVVDEKDAQLEQIYSQLEGLRVQNEAQSQALMTVQQAISFIIEKTGLNRRAQ